MDPMHILLVDDVFSERLHLELRLKKLGHVVKAVSSGQDALNCYATFDPDLVLLDICMPDMQGTELAQSIRERFTEWVPIIFLSGHSEPELIAEAIDKGGDDYLTKPVNGMVLSAKLKAMQRISAMRRKLQQTSLQLQKANELLYQQVNEDGLTALANRRYLDQKLTEFVSLHGRNGQPLTMIMLDVDHFKLFNDHYGHIEGDNCLKLLAETLKHKFSRAGEICARYGGEEFVILLSSCNSIQAKKECERLKQAIAALNIEHGFSQTSSSVTVSQGAITWIPTGLESIENLYQEVDKLLYQAKANGRDQYITADYMNIPVDQSEN
ncbi:GGDEF domain-containing response regulator [Photobacterium leiognathi]|uniref:GGDEF domain-containing response regulator n=1 Tax=Photobacterium leiognathi TaxID=553611 RepID=UPI0002088D24|nr:diguanylate cyclase [Photobacterium leiognathi]PSW55079.1 diguanylate cyclase response regulator [Photobacterium leiognathi subsp. mandapamensis]GAA06329.1 diguanylate cyclase domain protein [Photobacterium leiognathi subsp. mandapamensis svers.1.1.]